MSRVAIWRALNLALRVGPITGGSVAVAMMLLGRPLPGFDGMGTLFLLTGAATVVAFVAFLAVRAVSSLL